MQGGILGMFLSGHHAPLYFDSASMVTLFLLIGRAIEHRTRTRSSEALRTLLSLGARTATLLRTDKRGTTREVQIPVEDLLPGDEFLVRPGEKIATDGTVIAGSSAVDASLLTGESGARRGFGGRCGHRRNPEHLRVADGARNPRGF